MKKIILTTILTGLILVSKGQIWTSVGTDINGEAAGDKFGSSISLSSDGLSVAIGAHFNDGNGNNSGHVRVYKLFNSTVGINALENHAPNIGVDNNHSSNLNTSIIDKEINAPLFKLSPTLVQNNLTIGVNNEVAVYDIVVLNLKGEIVYQLNNLNAGETKINLPPGIKNGMYLLQASISNEEIETFRFVLYR